MVVVAGDFVYTKGQKEPYNIYSIFNGACEAIDPDSNELSFVYVQGMLFGLEAAVDQEGRHRHGDEGYASNWSPCGTILGKGRKISW